MSEYDIFPVNRSRDNSVKEPQEEKVYEKEYEIGIFRFNEVKDFVMERGGTLSHNGGFFSKKIAVIADKYTHKCLFDMAWNDLSKKR